MLVLDAPIIFEAYEFILKFVIFCPSPMRNTHSKTVKIHEKSPDGSIRLIDAGVVSPIYSQAIYHGIAEQMQPTDEPVLVIVRPHSPYICVGIHQSINNEIDTHFCKQNNIPIIRRHIGGGCVLLDQNQLFFQFIFPQSKAPNNPVQLYPWLLSPILKTFNAIGLNANLKKLNDIQVNQKKIGGTGCGTINQATVLVGSFLFDFDYELMAKCIAAPSENFRICFTKLLQNNLTTIHKELTVNIDEALIISQLTENISDSLSLSVIKSRLNISEQNAIEEAQQSLLDEEWLCYADNKLIQNGIKISAGTYLLESEFNINLKLKSLTFNIRALLKNNFIDTTWITSDSDNIEFNSECQALCDAINRKKPCNQFEEISKCLMGVNNKLKPEIVNQLAINITELLNITEY